MFMGGIAPLFVSELSESFSRCYLGRRAIGRLEHQRDAHRLTCLSHLHVALNEALESLVTHSAGDLASKR